MNNKYSHPVIHSRCSTSSDSDDICVISTKHSKGSNRDRDEICVHSTKPSRDSYLLRKHKETFMIDRNRQSVNEKDLHEYEDSKRISTRYPPVEAGTMRLKINHESYIQQDVEKKIRICPGLEHIIEIRRFRDTVYFCGICRRTYTKETIFQHLETSIHRVKSLKALDPKMYRHLASIPTKARKRELVRMLDFIQKNEGIGKIVVEKDYSTGDNYKPHQDLNASGTSSDSSSVIYCSESNSPVLSNYSKIEYFCSKCECHMFQADLWESHNKKFIKSLMKYPKSKIPRIERRPKSDAFLTGMILEEYCISSSHPVASEPIVGLDYIKEFQHIDNKSETYHCLLCGECLNCMNVLSHLITLLHRKKYLEKINHHAYDYVKSLSPNDNKTYFQVSDICRIVQKEYGTGCPEVYVIKNLKET